MRNKVKQIIVTILAIGLTLVLLPDIGIEKAYAAYEDEVWIDTDGKEMTAEEKANWYSTSVDDGIKVSYRTQEYINGKFVDKELVNGQITGKVPATINGKAVTSMEGAFANCKSLVKAPVIPNTVTNMYLIFRGCKSLTEVPAISASVTYIREAFRGCESLTEVPAIPDTVEDMQGIFYGCKSLTKAPAIPNKVTNIDGAFSGCTSLRQAPVIPDSVTSMEYAFQNCQQLYGKVELPSDAYKDNTIFNNCKTIITGKVTDLQSGKPIKGVTIDYTYGSGVVAIKPPQFSLWGTDPTDDMKVATNNITDSQGNYIITTGCNSGPITVTASYGDQTASESFNLNIYQNKEVNFKFDIPNSGEIEIPDPDVPLGPTPGTPMDGKVNGNMPVYGTVNPINIIDVTLPISMTFVIKADRTLQKPQDIKIESNCPAPLNTCILSINKSDNAPDLVAPDTYTDEQWNNLTKAKTYKEIALTMNSQDLSVVGNNLGNLRSAFNAADPSTPNTQELNLDLDVKYGKAWNNSQDYSFTYNTVFEFSML